MGTGTKFLMGVGGNIDGSMLIWLVSMGFLALTTGLSAHMRAISSLGQTKRFPRQTRLFARYRVQNVFTFSHLLIY